MIPKERSGYRIWVYALLAAPMLALGWLGLALALRGFLQDLKGESLISALLGLNVFWPAAFAFALTSLSLLVASRLEYLSVPRLRVVHRVSLLAAGIPFLVSLTCAALGFLIG